jgi:hypothetical protein
VKARLYQNKSLIVTMHLKTIGLLILINFDVIFCVKILKIGKIEEDKIFNVTIRNPPYFEHSRFSICWWVKTRFRNKYKFLDTDDYIRFEDYYGKGDTLDFYFGNGYEYKPHYIHIPKGQEIVPHSWTLFCISYNNDNKMLAVYLNSVQIYNKTEKSDLEAFTVEKDFLSMIKFQVDKNSGNLTGLNIWSDILTAEQVIDIYKCKPYQAPDLIAWENVKFDVNPPNINIQLSEINDKDGPCEENKEGIHVFKTMATMDNNKEAFRICKALGGYMNAFQSGENLKLLDSFSVQCPGREFWVPIFREVGRWVDTSNNQVSFLPWQKGEPEEGMVCAFYGEGKYWAGR